ncbi:hypothetical protein ACFQ0M_06015 [Kitasatospora aburaviensis]
MVRGLDLLLRRAGRAARPVGGRRPLSGALRGRAARRRGTDDPPGHRPGLHRQQEAERGALYQGPEKLAPTGINTFRRIADAPWVTDGAFSPDGTRLVLRGYFSATLYRWKDGAPALGALSAPGRSRASRSPSRPTAGRCSTGARARTARSGGRRWTTTNSPTPSSRCRSPRRRPRPVRGAAGRLVGRPGLRRLGGGAAGSSEGPSDRALGVVFVLALVGAVLGLRKKRKAS